jgi:hypothetical protein
MKIVNATWYILTFLYRLSLPLIMLPCRTLYCYGNQIIFISEKNYITFENNTILSN